MRALAVLVVATPCPLLLAAPVAIVSGLSRAARRGVIVKGGGPLETPRRGHGPAVRQDRHAHRGPPELAESSPRPASGPRTRCCGWPRRSSRCRRTSSPPPSSGGPRARRRALAPGRTSSRPGAGVSGAVGGSRGPRRERRLRERRARAAPLGTRRAPPARASRRDAASSSPSTGSWSVRSCSTIRSAPRRRAVIRALRRAGVRRTVMVTGDRHGVADICGRRDRRRRGAGRARPRPTRSTPSRAERPRPRRPRSWSATASTTRPPWPPPTSAWRWAPAARRASLRGRRHRHHRGPARPLAEAIRIARRSRPIAVQSVVVGMGLSIAAMAGRDRRCSRRRRRDAPGGDRRRRDPQRPARARRRPGEAAEDPGLDGDQHPSAQRAPRRSQGRSGAIRPRRGRAGRRSRRPSPWTSCSRSARSSRRTLSRTRRPRIGRSSAPRGRRRETTT